MPGQFGPDAAILDHGNNITVWSGLWIPDRYDAREISFAAIAEDLSQIYAIDNAYQWGLQWPIALTVQTSAGPAVAVPIIPAPASGVLLGLGLAIARRSRVGSRPRHPHAKIAM